MQDTITLARYPLHQRDSAAYSALMQRCQDRLAEDGLCDLPGFVPDDVIETCMAQLKPRFARDAFRHVRRHNIYFTKDIPGLAPDHPALAQCETSNSTLCAD